MRLQWLLSMAVIVTSVLIAPPAQAIFDLMQIEQVIGGVGGDITAQAITLRMRANFQNQLQESRLVAWDAAGSNPIVVSDPNSTVANSRVGDRVLIATAAFASVTTPPAVADFIMTQAIPQSYLAAGSLTFEDNSGQLIFWRVSWGGATYTGSTTGEAINDADGEFGAPVPGALPSSGLAVLQFQGAAADLSTNNAADYAVDGAPVVVVNNAGSSFTVNDPSTATLTIVPGPTALRTNYPNPFNPVTTIVFELAKDEHVTLQVFSLDGRLIDTLLQEPMLAGRRTVQWRGVDRRGTPVVSGTYVVRLKASDRMFSRKLTLLK